jgi:hypothetical protein
MRSKLGHSPLGEGTEAAWNWLRQSPEIHVDGGAE